MPSEIVADVGGELSNSYITIAKADSFADDMIDDGGWLGLDNDTKARFLLTSTKIIDSIRVKYPKLNENQKRKFPVKSEAGDGFSLVEEACIIQAIYLYKYSNQLEYATKSSITGIVGESYSAETNVSRIPANNSLKRFAPGVLSMLSSYIDMSISVFRG